MWFDAFLKKRKEVVGIGLGDLIYRAGVRTSRRNRIMEEERIEL